MKPSAYIKKIYVLSFLLMPALSMAGITNWLGYYNKQYGISFSYPPHAMIQSKQFTRTWFLHARSWSSITSDRLSKTGSPLLDIKLIQMNPNNKPILQGDTALLMKTMTAICKVEKQPSTQAAYLFPYYMGIRIGMNASKQAQKMCYVNPQSPASMALETQTINGRTYHVLHYAEADIGAKSIKVTSYRALIHGQCYAIDIAQDMANVFEMRSGDAKANYVTQVSKAYQQLAGQVLKTIRIH